MTPEKKLFSAQHIKCAFLLHSINEKVGHLKSSLQKQVRQQRLFKIRLIKSCSDIPEKECSRALMSMILGKAANRVLRKEPKGEIKKTDKIMVNDSFTSKLHKVKILSVTAKTVSKPILT